ncbi:immune inhibitor A [Brevibacillus humidisoli]|uniref:immune inhibitor A domain-containing protein n=1 Tax=Brevibacillus humidisoli TaxID=2895522 RepID=UPI001E38D6B3|nr:immune inhibitor A domain-containing protein [Brevibacillus humidisoli]UFJ40159.1 immune inhibitor A [Brevibacillus humidisoli]
MKRTRKVMAGIMSSTLVLGALFGTPLSAAAKDEDAHVDWAVVNTDRLVNALIEQGELDEDASPEEIDRVVKRYVTRPKRPGTETLGIDTSTKIGKKALKGKLGVQQNGMALVSGSEKAKKVKKKDRAHVDNAVVALIEYQDFTHNNIEDDGYYFWTADFNQEHYENMLFNEDGYTTPEGKELITMTQYYDQQSAGSWKLEGTVTPWIMAENDADYYGGNDANGNDERPRELVMETLEQVGEQISDDWEKYDQRDPYDLDGDLNVMEPDGLLDTLMIVHSGIGEEAGGGELGENAIWSHRWTLREPTDIPGTPLKAYDYIIQPEDGAVGVFAHEYGHNLGLPDEYDTGYSGTGSPVEVWSLMSGGSWAGQTPGTEPTGFSPWAKLYLRETLGGNWPEPQEIDLDDLRRKKKVKLDEAVSMDDDGKLLKINLPDREMEPPTQPKDGDYAYFSTKGNDLDSRMTSPEIDLTAVNEASLRFDSWRQIETGYDYLYVNVYAEGSEEPEQIEGYDDTTDGEWESEELDLSDFVGQKIRIEFQYKTDGGLIMEGFYVDNIEVVADDEVIFQDDAEGEPLFELDGFEKFDGSPILYPSYYLVEWRSHNGVDIGLAHYRRNNSLLVYDPGLLIWYYDGRWGEDNMTGNHPGEGFLGVVDAHQRGHYWDDGTVGSTRFQINDAAFGLSETSDINVVYPTFSMVYEGLPGVSTFSDEEDYSSPFNPDGGKILPEHGLEIEVKKVKKDGREVEIEVRRD